MLEKIHFAILFSISEGKTGSESIHQQKVAECPQGYPLSD